ncbi:MAG: hypothetical protein K2Q26_04630 [Bdellovibrionales bacterium]|nr:hypothetical protein [Bdellovibrionales bacterium]
MKFEWLFLVAFLLSCSTRPTEPIDPPLKSISIGNLKNIIFDSHVGRPQYETDAVHSFKCSTGSGATALTSTSSEKDYVDFFCSKYRAYIPYVEALFENRILFATQKKYAEIQILWGDAIYQTSPDVYVIRKSHPIDANVIFHELGHRLSWLLVNDLNIPLDETGFLNIGLIDYLAASVANDPVLAKSFAPPIFVRDIRLKKRYPNDLAYFSDLSKKFYSTYAKDFNLNPYHKTFYDMFIKMASENEKLIEGHTSGMIISHLLWDLREKYGADKMDKIVAKSILRLKDLPSFRKMYLRNLSEKEFSEKKIQWFDFLASLAVTIKETESCNSVLKTSEDAGFKMVSKLNFKCD